jgi:hypothetical protein
VAPRLAGSGRGRPAGDALPEGLLAVNIDFQGDLARNIPGIRRSQQLFDDLSDEPGDWAIAIAAESAARPQTEAALISRPFDYGSVITFAFEHAHWVATRFSDGSRYGIWYGSTAVETTVYETAWHWTRFVLDSYAAEAREIVSERRVFDVRCEALLIDLVGAAKRHPALVSRTSYALTHAIGRVVHDQGLNGVLTRSARCDGINAAIFKPERLSEVRDRAYLTYRFDPARDRVVVERTPGRAWLRITPSELG